MDYLEAFTDIRKTGDWAFNKCFKCILRDWLSKGVYQKKKTGGTGYRETFIEKKRVGGGGGGGGPRYWNIELQFFTAKGVYWKQEDLTLGFYCRRVY